VQHGRLVGQQPAPYIRRMIQIAFTSAA
jgi:hypothetical protein